MSEEERGLVLRAVQGDTDAFELLIRPHQNRLFRLIIAVVGNPEDAEDCLQEALVHAYRAAGTFRGDSSFGTWLYRVALNVTRNWLRHQARNSSSPLPTALACQEPDQAPPPETALMARETEHAVRVALRALPPLYREPIVLRHWHGMTYEDIARVLNVPVGTVRSRLSQGRRLLVERLNALGYSELAAEVRP